jgi:hypothetical protein
MWRILPKAVVAAGALVVLGAGCSTDQMVQHKEDLLASEGFVAYPAVTPGQDWLVSNLPTNKVSTVVRQGKVYFVFPDASQDVVFVGHEPQYLDYMLKAQKQGYGTGGWDAEFGPWDPDEQ